MLQRPEISCPVSDLTDGHSGNNSSDVIISLDDVITTSSIHKGEELVSGKTSRKEEGTNREEAVYVPFQQT
jgi:hypothetical protein